MAGVVYNFQLCIVRDSNHIVSIDICRWRFSGCSQEYCKCCHVRVESVVCRIGNVAVFVSQCSILGEW